MKKLVFAGLFALTVLGFSSSQASAFYPCYEVYRPCWQIPLPKFPLVIPNVKFYCADCCPPVHGFAQPWYLYYPPQTYGGYNSPWLNYAAPQAYPYAAAPANFGNYAATPQNYGNYAAAPEQVPAAPRAAPNFGPQGYYAGQDFGAQGNFAPPAYWYGR